jgi:hypothetical protein
MKPLNQLYQMPGCCHADAEEPFSSCHSSIWTVQAAPAVAATVTPMLMPRTPTR